MTQDISKDMYFLYKNILRNLPKKEIDLDVDTIELEKDIIAFVYKFFDKNYFDYRNKRDLPHLEICNVALQYEDGDNMVQGVYDNSSNTIFLDRTDVKEIAHGKRKLGDLINSLGHEYRHFLQYRANVEDMQSEIGKEIAEKMMVSLYGEYIGIFDDDLFLDKGVKPIKKFCEKKSLKNSKFAQFVSETIEKTGYYSRTIAMGQDASQIHEEDARLAGIVFCSDFYNRMIREAVRRGDSRFEKQLEKQKKIDVEDSIEYTEDFAYDAEVFKKYIDVLKEEDSLFFIQLAIEAYSKQDKDLIYFLNKTLNDKCLLSSSEQLQNLVSDILLSWDIQDEQLKKMADFSKENELTEEQQKRLDKCEKSELAQRYLFAYILENDAFKNKDLIFYPNEEKIVKNMAKYDMKRFKKIPTLKKQNFFNEVSK